jgi:hypothetical protein
MRAENTALRERVANVAGPIPARKAWSAGITSPPDPFFRPLFNARVAASSVSSHGYGGGRLAAPALQPLSRLHAVSLLHLLLCIPGRLTIL